MNRRTFLLSSTAGFAGLALSPGRMLAQQPPAAPPVTRFEELRRGVGMFIGQGGTIGYLVNADGAVAVDSQFMNTATICAAGLKERAPKGVAMLLNTHHHGDHTGGNKAYGVSKIIAHANCLKSHRAVMKRRRRSIIRRTRRARSPTSGPRSSAARRSRCATTAPGTPAATR